MSSFRIIRKVLVIGLLCALSAIGCFVSPSSFKSKTQAIKTTVADIVENPDKYDGKMVQVEGRVFSLQTNPSRMGPYTTFKLGGQSGKTLSFVSLGILTIKEGDFVSVTAKYNESDSLIWTYSIENPGNGSIIMQ